MRAVGCSIGGQLNDFLPAGSIYGNIVHRKFQNYFLFFCTVIVCYYIPFIFAA